MNYKEAIKKVADVNGEKMYTNDISQEPLLWHGISLGEQAKTIVILFDEAMYKVEFDIRESSLLEYRINCKDRLKRPAKWG